MSFKLLAIRPLKGCNKEFLKNLEENRIYKFYSDYKFYNNDKELCDNEDFNVTNIKYKPTIKFPKNLYGENIDVSAIVGKNGSGKSALVQLLCAGIYNLSIVKGFIKVDNLTNEIIDKLKVQIFYSYKHRREDKKLMEDFYVLEINVDKIRLYDNYIEGKFNYEKDDYDQLSKSIPFLFYTIVNNYSIYGLNSNEVGTWINKIFIKNDGYKTPIVINPFRENGNIDVNLETFFAKNRLLSNLLNLNLNSAEHKNKESIHSEIINDFFKRPYAGGNSVTNLENKKVEKIILSLKFDKFQNEKKEIELEFLEYAEDYLYLIFNSLYISDEEKKDYTKYDILELLKNSTISEKYAINYIFYKLEKIKPFIKKGNISEESYLKYLNSLNNEYLDSHVFFKIYQTINFLKYDIYKDFKDKTKFEIILDEYNENSISSKMLSLMTYEREKFKEKYKAQIIIFPPLLISNVAFLPPPIFDIDILFNENQGKLSDLSSGEKQIIYSIQSVLYHLINISSKNSLKNRNITKYQDINVIFDEVELYFHPNMQRKFISSLMQAIKGTYLPNIKTNILFITHSPFILSDIPKQNVLFLEIDKESKKAIPKTYKGDNTFGENIHQMLTDGFFLDSTKGEVAISNINKFLQFYKENIDLKEKPYNIEIDLDNYSKIISLIGEDYIRTVLGNHLAELKSKFSGKSLLDIESEELIKRLKEINPEIKIEGI